MLLLAWPGLNSLYFTWHNRDATLWLCWLLCWSTQRAQPTSGESDMGEKNKWQGQEHSCPQERERQMSHSPFLTPVSGQNRTSSLKTCRLISGRFCHRISDFNASSSRWTGCHRPRSIHCVVRVHHSHGLLLARAVPRSAKISWPPAAGFRVVVFFYPPTWDTLQNGLHSLQKPCFRFSSCYK